VYKNWLEYTSPKYTVQKHWGNQLHVARRRYDGYDTSQQKERMIRRKDEKHLAFLYPPKKLCHHHHGVR